INEADNAYLLSSLKDYEVITPDYEQAFLDIDYSKFDHALKTFKNTKSFFEKNEREKMKDMFYEILDDESKIYLDENEVIIIQYYDEQWDSITHDLMNDINKEINPIVKHQISIISETVDIDSLKEKEVDLNRVLKQIKNEG